MHSNRLNRFPDLAQQRREALGSWQRVVQPAPIPFHLFRVGQYCFFDDWWEAHDSITAARKRTPNRVWRMFVIHKTPVSSTYAILRTH